MNIQNKKIVIIGGASGIGFAVAQQALAAGANVIIAGRNHAKLTIAQAQLSAVKIEQINVADESSVSAFFDRIGELDHLVITAGSIIGSKKLVDQHSDEARAAFDTKFWGQWLAAKYAAPRINAGGSIGFTSGVVGRKHGVGSLVKTTINAAVEAMSRTLAKELAPVRVYTVSPGPMDTGMWDLLSPEARQKVFADLAKSLPVGFVGTPEDTAAGYLFAMQNSSMTGALLDIDSGALIN